MVRTAPSAVDAALIEEVGKLGFTVTLTQLERWRGKAYLPSNPRKFLGQGKGSASGLRQDIVRRVTWLAFLSRPGRSISVVGWVFWALNDNKASARRLRTAVLQALDKPMVRAGLDELPDGDTDEAAQARAEAADRLAKGRPMPRADLDGMIREHAAQAEYVLPLSDGAVPNVFDRALTEPGARLLVGGTNQMPVEEILDRIDQTWPHLADEVDDQRRYYLDAQLAGKDLWEQHPLADGMKGLRRAVVEADDQALCAAVRTCTKAASTLGAVLEHAANYPHLLEPLMRDPMWHEWGRMLGGLFPGKAGEAAIALETALALHVPYWAPELDRYRTKMEFLLRSAASSQTV